MKQRISWGIVALVAGIISSYVMKYNMEYLIWRVDEIKKQDI